MKYWAASKNRLPALGIVRMLFGIFLVFFRWVFMNGKVMWEFVQLSLHIHSLPEAQGSGPLMPSLGKLQAPHRATGVSL